MRLGWYEGYSTSGQPEYVNLDVCWRITVARSTGFDGPYAVWAWFGERGVILAGTHGTEEQAATYLKEIFDTDDSTDDGE